LPAGWCGKNFACASLAAEARSDWMLFLDSDARLSQNAIKIMMAEAQHRKCSFLSCWPGLILESTWEYVLMPMLNFVVFTLFPAPISIKKNNPSLGLAHGACIMIRSSEYLLTGGHRLVFDKLFEDTCLARAWRTSGRRGICLDGQELVKVRMYESVGDILRGFQKNFYPAFSRDFSFWLFIGFHAACFVLPFIVAPLIFTGRTDLWPAGITALCIMLARLVQVWQFGYSFWAILMHPLAEIILISVGLSSWWKCHWGQGVEWKGRVYKSSVSNENSVVD
ncbi:MAG: glycosyltransferase, partial [Thermodesulfobacteriota bacterium]|nr:glycosyltransferase [Thermodesulfobacteriota bacterium]